MINNSILKPNAKVTIVKQTIKNRETYYKTINTYNAFWQENKGINTNSSSRDRKDIDKITCYILEVLKEIEVEDILIRNDNNEEIESLRTLREYQNNYDAHTITSADVYDFGNKEMQHTRIGAK